MIRWPAVFAFAAMCTSSSTFGQDYPNRPITLIVPAAAGGPSDALGRMVTHGMAGTLGQPIVIESVSGAGGSIGVGRVVRAAPDGYTIGIGHWGTHVVNGAMHDLPYNLVKDLEPVAMIARNPQLLVSNNAVPAKDLRELMAWIRANPEKVSIATSGVGSAAHVSAIYLQNLTGAKLLVVPYRGAAPGLKDLMAGRIHLKFEQPSNSLAHIRAGAIRAYAVTAKTRLAAAADIPTMEEAGLPGFHIDIWYGIWAPSGIAKRIVARLNSAAVNALADPGLRQRLADLGLEIPPREQQTPEALAAQQKAEIEKWWPILKASGIKAE